MQIFAKVAFLRELAVQWSRSKELHMRSKSAQMINKCGQRSKGGAGNKEMLLRILNSLPLRTHNILSVNIDWIRFDKRRYDLIRK